MWSAFSLEELFQTFGVAALWNAAKLSWLSPIIPKFNLCLLKMGLPTYQALSRSHLSFPWTLLVGGKLCWPRGGMKYFPLNQHRLFCKGRHKSECVVDHTKKMYLTRSGHTENPNVDRRRILSKWRFSFFPLPEAFFGKRLQSSYDNKKVVFSLILGIGKKGKKKKKKGHFFVFLVLRRSFSCVTR